VKTLGVSSTKSGSHVCGWDYDDVTPDILTLFSLVTEATTCVVKVRAGARVVWSKGKDRYVFSVRALNKEKRNQYSSTSLTGDFDRRSFLRPLFRWRTDGGFLTKSPFISTICGLGVITVAIIFKVVKCVIVRCWIL